MYEETTECVYSSSRSMEFFDDFPEEEPQDEFSHGSQDAQFVDAEDFEPSNSGCHPLTPERVLQFAEGTSMRAKFNDRVRAASANLQRMTFEPIAGCNPTVEHIPRFVIGDLQRQQFSSFRETLRIQQETMERDREQLKQQDFELGLKPEDEE